MLKNACLVLVFVVACSNAAPGQAVWSNSQQDTLSALVGQIVQTHSSSGSSSHGGMNHDSGFVEAADGGRYGGNGHHHTGAHYGPRGGGGHRQGQNGYEPNCSVFESAHEEVQEMLGARLSGRLSPQLIQNLHSHLKEVTSILCSNRRG